MKPRFYVALAHTDDFAHFKDEQGEKKDRVSNLNLLPEKIKENVLFSMSFDSKIHYSSMSKELDPIADHSAKLTSSKSPRRLFADCGAYQFRDLEVPTVNGSELDAYSAWENYKQRHLEPEYEWEDILLCSPDHIVTREMNDEEVTNRFKFIKANADDFLELTKAEKRVTAVGVIHGRTNEERMSQYKMFKKMGYKYVALGGMVPYSTNIDAVLNIIAGIKDVGNPKINSSSILAKCRSDGIKLHIFGLNSLEYIRWWYRLKIDSFDGSKLSTEGAANGWYYVANDGGGSGRSYPDKPENANALFQRISVKKMDFKNWKWGNDNLMTLPNVPLVDGEVDTSCDCPACQYLKSARCTSSRCWLWNESGIQYRWRRHASDPRMMGSTEHNMGRVAHNAHVFQWVIEEIEKLNTIADESHVTDQNEWLTNWKSIEYEGTIHVLFACSKTKSLPPPNNLKWTSSMNLEKWNRSWLECKGKIPVKDLYTGRSFTNTLAIIRKQENVRGYVLSAGGGLIPLESEIPPYDATFGKSSDGPKSKDWAKLPLGGLSNLELSKDDIIVSFAPPNYHKALEVDPDFLEIKNPTYITSSSRLVSYPNMRVIEIHPRTSEYLNIAQVDQSWKFFEIFMEHGLGEFKRIYRESKKMPAKSKRKPITDEVLQVTVDRMNNISVDGIVRHVRDVMNLSVSRERVSDAKK